MFVVASGNRRCEKFKLHKRRVNLNVGKLVFSNRICDDWNRLSAYIAEATTLNTFKARLDRHLRVEWGLK